ncbi:unnamed protein product [Rotaria socialis]
MNVHSNKSTISSVPIKALECFKNISKKKQLSASTTNRSFIISNKYSVPDVFYEKWEEGITHKNTSTCQMIF